MPSKSNIITRYSPSSYTEAKQGVNTPELSPEALVGKNLVLIDNKNDLALSERVKVLKIGKKLIPGRRRRHQIQYLNRGKKWVKLSRRGDKIQNYALVNSSSENTTRKKRTRTVTSEGTRTKPRTKPITKRRTKRRTKHRRRTKRR